MALVVLLVVVAASHRHMLWQSTAISAACFAFGAVMMARAVLTMKVDLPETDVDYEAVVVSEPIVHGRVVMTDLLVLTNGGSMKVKASFLRDTTDGRWQQLQVGSGLRVRSLLVAPTNYRGGSFDYAGYLKEHGYRASTLLYSDHWQFARVDVSQLSHWQRVVLAAKQWRRKLLSRVERLGVEGQDYAVLVALTLGEKSFLSQETKDDYSISGASHVLALSGLHLGIIYALFTFLLFRWRKRWLAQLLVLTLIWAYVVLVGFSPSVVRSAVMLTLCSLGLLLNRGGFSLNTLSLAAIVMLCANPLTLFDLGFQMSFLAVLGILLFVPLFSKMVSEKFLFSHRCVAWVWNMVVVSVSAQLLIFPLVAYHFGRFSSYFLLSNFIAIPCATLLLYGAVLLIPLSFVPVVGSVLATGLTLIAKLMNGGLQLIASLPGASVEPIVWSAGQTICVYVLLAVFYAQWRFMLDHGMIGHDKLTEW